MFRACFYFKKKTFTKKILRSKEKGFFHSNFCSRPRLEAMSEDTVQLKCLIHNVHHEIDMEKFSVEWIASGYNSMPKLESGAESPQNGKN